MRTVAVIPTRYEPKRLKALVDLIAPECDRVLVMDNGHAKLPTLPANAEVIDCRGEGLYRMWNRGTEMARGDGVNVAILNDDIRILPGTLRLLAKALRSEDDVACVYPDRRVRLEMGLPARIELTTDRDPIGSREMTGYCFMFKAELPLPAFDEGYAWWYGDTVFDEGIRLAGYGVAQVNALPIEHTSDAEADGWARRPELRQLAELDGQRWAELHAEIRDGRWAPRSPVSDLRTVLLVPRREDHGHRDALWAWAKARWEREFPTIPIYEGHHTEGPFNRSAAINTAARLAGDWDLGVVIDADIFVKVGQLFTALDRAAQTGRVTWAHRRWRGLSESATARVLKTDFDFGPQLQRHDMDLFVERTNPLSWSCCVVIPRKVWNDMGGFDERFQGWGFEDMAFMSLVCGLYGHERIEGDVYHLWHPRSEERIIEGHGRITASPEYVTNARLGRRYMVALRRDHGLHDRPGLPSTDEERERDIAALKHDDAKFASAVKRHHLPDWTDWWPGLLELQAGAREFLKGPPPPTVTVVVHTGGEPEAWDERSRYLAQSLASLVKRVKGPIIQRVVYSDWGPAFDGRLRELVDKYGFYVAGEGHHGYTGSMVRMWRYLNRRAQGSHIFATEDDFLYERPVDLEKMAAALRDEPQLRQLALLRAAYYPREVAAGGVIEALDPEAFVKVSANGHSRIEHRDHWTANPSLFRKALTDTRWPNRPSSERHFGNAVLADPNARFAYWGEGEPWIRHIGAVRAGAGY